MKKKKSIVLLLMVLCLTVFAGTAHAENWFSLSRYYLTLYMGEGCQMITQYVKYDDMTIYGDSKNHSIAKIDWTKTSEDDEFWFIKPVSVGTTTIEFEDDYGDTRTVYVTVKPMRAKGVLKSTSFRKIYYGDNRIVGKTVPGSTITFKLRGKTYKAKANSKGKFNIRIKSAKAKKIVFTIKTPGNITVKKTVKVSK